MVRQTQFSMFTAAYTAFYLFRPNELSAPTNADHHVATVRLDRDLLPRARVLLLRSVKDQLHPGSTVFRVHNQSASHPLGRCSRSKVAR